MAQTVIRLLVTLNGPHSSVAVERLSEEERPSVGDTDLLALGRSLSDALKAIEAAALESQGRTR